MERNNKRLPYQAIIGALGISFFLTAFLYFFFLQTPALGRREIFFCSIIFVALTIGLSFFLSRFMIPTLKNYSTKAKTAWFLLSALIGIFAVWITLTVPYFIHSLPKNRVEINIPDGDPGRVITLQWLTTSLGDISFDQLKQDGEWIRTEAGLVHSGSAPAGLRWTGRGGDTFRVVFIGAPETGRISIRVNGTEQELSLDSPLGTPVDFQANLPVHPAGKILVQTCLWFSASFLFLALTLFLVHVSLVPGRKLLKSA